MRHLRFISYTSIPTIRCEHVHDYWLAKGERRAVSSQDWKQSSFTFLVICNYYKPCGWACTSLMPRSVTKPKSIFVPPFDLGRTLQGCPSSLVHPYCADSGTSTSKVRPDEGAGQGDWGVQDRTGWGEDQWVNWPRDGAGMGLWHIGQILTPIASLDGLTWTAWSCISNLLMQLQIALLGQLWHNTK